MPKKSLFIVLGLAIVGLFVWSVVQESRIAAAAGAGLLLIGIIYGTLRTGRSKEGVARAERGADELRNELAEDEARRGTR